MFIMRNGSEVQDPRLGRLPQFDERSREYPIRTLIRATAEPRSYTWRCDTWLDQGMEGSCVGHAFAHDVAARPVVKTADSPLAWAIYKRAQQIDEWAGECVDMETECLTRDGWKRGDELQVDDEILTFDLQTETTRWAVVEKIHLYDSKAYRIWSHKGASVAVTDNHRWPVRMRPNGSEFSRPFRMTTTADWRSGDEFIRAAVCSDLPIEPKWDDDFVELVAWVMTEGSYRPDTRRGNGIVVSQKVELDRVADLMSRMGVAAGHRKADGTHCWELSGDLARAIREVAPERAPRIEWLSTLTLRQLKLFLEVCNLGDGCGEPAKDNRQTRSTFAQKTGAILDSWLAATALAGQPVSRASEKTGSLSNVETWTLRKSNSIETRRLQPSLYLTGSVWCPQTEIGTFVARRNGTIFITGNSYEGTSVLAGAKATKERGHLAEYRWAFSMEDLILAVGYKGPAILGVNWYEGMFDTDAKGWIRPTGRLAGGHAILVHSVNVKQERFILHNSWGKFWGINGRAQISFDDLERLLNQDGEACIPVKRT